MAYRIVKIGTRSKLETSLNYLVVRNDKETRILLDDIQVLIIESQQICITSSLMTELMKHKVKVIFCDETHNPQGELIPYNSCYDTASKIRQQFKWKDEVKDKLWSEIVYRKIRNQAMVLSSLGCEEQNELLNSYMTAIEPGDRTNREGLAAKVYFFGLFGHDFDRHDHDNPINAYLNYGYSLILGAVNREISAFGYLTQVGIHHIGETNPFNLGCDLMEPFRPFVDSMVVNNDLNQDNFKSQLLNVLTMKVVSNGRNTFLQNAIHDFVQSAFTALNSENVPVLYDVSF